MVGGFLGGLMGVNVGGLVLPLHAHPHHQHQHALPPVQHTPVSLCRIQLLSILFYPTYNNINANLSNFILLIII